MPGTVKSVRHDQCRIRFRQGPSYSAIELPEVSMRAQDVPSQVTILNSNVVEVAVKSITQSTGINDQVTKSQQTRQVHARQGKQ